MLRTVIRWSAPPAILDDLLPARDRLPVAVAQVGVADDPLEVEVGDVGAEVGEAPGDVGVVADDDARHPGEREAADVGAGRLGRDRAAVQAVLDPHPGLADGEVRVVGEQRPARRRALPGDGPRVGADALAASDELRHRVERLVDGGVRAVAPGRT